VSHHPSVEKTLHRHPRKSGGGGKRGLVIKQVILEKREPLKKNENRSNKKTARNMQRMTTPVGEKKGEPMRGGGGNLGKNASEHPCEGSEEQDSWGIPGSNWHCQPGKKENQPHPEKAQKSHQNKGQPRNPTLAVRGFVGERHKIGKTRRPGPPEETWFRGTGP